MALLIDGKRISSEIKDELKEEVAQLKEQGITGALAVIQVGNDPASSVYVRNKKRACEYIGIDSLSYELPEETSQDLSLIHIWFLFLWNIWINGICIPNLFLFSRGVRSV